MVIRCYSKIAVLLVVGFVFALHAGAQTGRLFTVDSDLSSSLITDIHQDRDGYIWIATEDGLNKFDGIRFTMYRQDQQEDSRILHNIVHVITDDAEGRMYVGYINGLQYYDPAGAEFHTIPFVLHNNVIVDAHVKSVFQRKNGQVLVGTSGFGLFEVVTDDGQLYCRELPDAVPSKLVEAVFEDSNGMLWVATEDRGLFRITGNSRRNYFASKGQKNVISSIAEDNDGTVWFGSSNQGLFRYVAQADTFCRINHHSDDVLPVWDIAVTDDNGVYVATDGSGIKVVDTEAGTLADVDIPVPTFSFPKSKMHALLEDNDGNIWMGAYQTGVFVLPAHRHGFGYIGYKSVNRDFIGRNAVMSVFEDHGGTLWVGTDKDGLYRLDPELTTGRHYAGGGVPGTIMTVFEDSKENLWIGAYLDGLARFDRTTGEISHPVELTDRNGAKVEHVFHMTEDVRQRLWIATMGSGLFRLDLNTGNVKRYNAADDTKFKPYGNHLPNDWMNCVLLSDNKLYFGTYDGLGCLDLETESFVSVLGRNRLFSDAVVYSLYDDKQGNLWVGTSTGLKRMDMASLEVEEFGMDDGLSSHTIWSIEGDRAGNLWLSTNRGIVRMDVERKQFLNFYSGDGLQGDEFMRGVSLQRGNGSLFFGGLHGLNYFNPEDIQMQPKQLTVHLVDFFINGKPVSKGMKSGSYHITDTAVHHETEFRLAYHDNSFAVEFSTMDFSDSERVIFQYSMNGNSWVSLGPSNNRITFEDLPPGTHRLRVRATAPNAVSTVRDMTVVVHPVWFLSATAKIFYLVAVLLAAVVLSRIVRNRKRARRQLLRQRRRQEINDAKLQLFVSLAHEIRTPLTLIHSPLKKLMQHDNPESTDYLYRIMDRNVHRMLDLVNQMMDAQKIEKGQLVLKFAEVDMIRYTREVCALFDEQFRAKDIHFTLDLPEGHCPAVIDPLNFDKVLVNVLSNACRFTPSEGHIRVALSRVEHRQRGTMLTLSVADSGQQIDVKEMDRIFECFYQSDHYRNHHSGAGLGLYLAKQLMTLHGGDIRAENLAQGGCRFVLTFPASGPEEAVAEVVTGSISESPERMPAIAEAPETTDAVPLPNKVVVVDDDPDILNYLKGELAPFYTVAAFSEGEAAYKHMQSDPPDLVVSDVMMPVLDGLSLCDRIRTNPAISHIPVVLLTAKVEDADNADGLGHGADAYLTKPFSTDVLLNTIRSIINNRELTRKNEREHRFQTDYISKVAIKSADEKLLEKVHQLIEQHIGNPLLSVEMIAGEVGISRVHLHRKLKQLTNMTTRDLIRSIRLKQAAQLMEKDGLSVSEVAYAVGYSDLSNFSLSFKQTYGMSPSAYAAQKAAR